MGSEMCIRDRFYPYCVHIIQKIENVAIANALQLEAARRRAGPIPFNTSPVSSLKSLSLSVAVLERISADMLRYAVISTFDLEPSYCIVCDLTKLCAKFEGNRTIRGRVIAV